MAQPFARAMQMAAAIAQAMLISDVAQRQATLHAIGPYESRGHGAGRRPKSRNTTAQVKRASIKAKNRSQNRSAHK